MTRLALRALLLALAFFAIGALVSPLLPATALAAAGTRPPSLVPLLLSNLLVAAVVIGLLSRTAGGFAARAQVACVVLAGLQLNNLVELLIFDVGIPRAELPRFFVHGAVSGVLCGLAAAAISGAARTDLPPTAVRATPGRLAAIVAAYVAIYFTAGLAVFPYIVTFYDPSRLPSHWTMLPMSMLRGSVFALLALLIARSVRGSLAAGALAVGLTLSLVGGVAPLLPDNPFMPEAMRYAHMVEVGISNLLFGAFAAWLLRRDETMAG